MKTNRPNISVRMNKKQSVLLIGIALVLLLTGIALATSSASSNVVIYAFDQNPAGSEWIEKADTPGAGGYGEAVIGTDENIYVARCLYASSTPYFWSYDPATDSWASKNTTVLPTGAFRNGAALGWEHNDSIYALLGGRYSDSNRTLFYGYSISNDAWERLTDTSHAQGAGDAITWSGYDDLIYALLGSKEHGTVFASYNLSNNSWSTLPFNPNWTTTDDGASLVWTGEEYLYALRGEWQETAPCQDFARYHIPTKTWQDMSSIPESGGVGDGGSLLWINAYQDYIFALGGNSCLEEPGYNFYRYIISSDRWEDLEPIPCPVGNYVGNRLGFAEEHIYYWQGAPSSWECGGDAFYMFEFHEFVFDTGNGTYPSISGTHNGTITPSGNITVSKLYTYPCAGTGGHTASIELYENGEPIANGTWSGYKGDWHNITIHNLTGGTPYVTLLKAHEYRYVIKTGSYPQIIHEPSKEVTGGTITCTKFTDANGKEYNNWIPAIRLE